MSEPCLKQESREFMPRNMRSTKAKDFVAFVPAPLVGKSKQCLQVLESLKRSQKGGQIMKPWWVWIKYDSTSKRVLHLSSLCSLSAVDNLHSS
mmetsp:Transcript_14173/g.24200  ORF Transcript_14173/g.24200 Transcript_14173/m.24200 type:complete len:93 (+) Transcript_14173:390-668(+)